MREFLEVFWKCRWETEKNPGMQSTYKFSSSKTKEKVYSVEFTGAQSVISYSGICLCEGNAVFFGTGA